MTAYVDSSAVIAAIPYSARPDPDDAAEGAAVVARITSLCTSTADMIDAEIGVDFHRHPADEDDADEVRILDGRGGRKIHVHRGIVSLTSVEIRLSAALDWQALNPGDWELVSMYEDESGRPYDHIRLTGVGRNCFPSGERNVRATGVFGWNLPPARLVEANIAWVRQHLAAGDSYSGGMLVPEGGTVIVPRLQIPDDVRMFLVRESRRYEDCWT